MDGRRLHSTYVTDNSSRPPDNGPIRRQTNRTCSKIRHSTTMSLLFVHSLRHEMRPNYANCEWDEWGQSTYLVISTRRRRIQILSIIMNLVWLASSIHSFNWYPNNNFSIFFSSLANEAGQFAIFCMQRWTLYLYAVHRRRRKKLNWNYTFCASSHINHQKKIKYKSGQWHIASTIEMSAEWSRIEMAAQMHRDGRER